MTERRRRTASALVRSGVVLAMAAPSAHAQQLVADGYSSVPAQSGATLSLWGSQPYQPGSYALALGLEVRSLHIAAEADAAAADASGSVSSFELLGSLGVWRGIDLTAAIALDRVSLETPDENDGATQSRAGLGEIRWIPRARLLGVDEGSGLAVLLPVGLPSKSNALYAGRSVRVEPRLAGTLHWGWLITTANLGYTVHAAEEDLGTSSANFVSGGLGAELRIVPAWSMLTELAGRWSPHDRAATTDEGLAADAHVAARFSSSGWAAQFGAGTGLTSAPLEPDWRVLASVSFSPAPDTPPASPPVEPPATDSSDSYLNDTSDWAPPAAADAAATAPIPAKVTGDPPAPLPHREPAVPPPSSAEAIAELERALAREPAQEDIEGLKRALAGVSLPLPEIDDVLHFAPNQMRLSGPQLTALDSVVAQLEAAPPDAHLVVEGHSDSAGPRAFNWKLSRMRASTVRFHLIEAGIGWRRISVQAYGASRPLRGESSTDRRVEFRLVRASQLQPEAP